MFPFDGVSTHLGNLYRLSKARSFSISPENFTGEKGQGGIAVDGTGAPCARDLGPGWKISPSVEIEAGETFTVAAIQGSGAIRWHIPDPIRFEHDLRIGVQALGWRSGGRYLPLQCDIASVAYWYQSLPTEPFPELPERDFLEIN